MKQFYSTFIFLNLIIFNIFAAAPSDILVSIKPIRVLNEAEIDDLLKIINDFDAKKLEEHLIASGIDDSVSLDTGHSNLLCCAVNVISPESKKIKDILDTFKVLLKYVDINQKKGTNTVLDILIFEKPSEKTLLLIKFLLENGADSSIIDENLYSSLISMLPDEHIEQQSCIKEFQKTRREVLLKALKNMPEYLPYMIGMYLADIVDFKTLKRDEAIKNSLRQMHLNAIYWISEFLQDNTNSQEEPINNNESD